MTTIAHAAEVLAAGLKLVANLDAPFRDKAERLRLAEDTMTAVGGFLGEVIAAHPQEAAGHWPTAPAGSLDLPPPADRADSFQDVAGALRGIGLQSLAERLDALCSPYGDKGPTLNGVLPALLLGDVASDEIDEDPEDELSGLFAIDADDPDGGRNTIPVEALAGCHVMIVEDAESAAVIDAKYRAENDGDEEGDENPTIEGRLG